MVAAPLLPNGSPKPSARFQDLVAGLSVRSGIRPGLCVPAGGNDGRRLSTGDGFVTGLGVIGAIGADRVHGLPSRDLGEQLWQHGRIADGVVGDLDGSDLQRLRVDAQLDFAPLTPVLSSMLLHFPFPFTQHLHARAVDQQVQPASVGTCRDGHAQGLLAPAQGAAIGYWPIEPGEPQQALGQPSGLAQPKAEHALEREAELDCGVTEDGWPSIPASGRCLPLQVCIEPDHQ